MSKVTTKFTALLISVVLLVSIYSNAYFNCYCYTKNEIIDVELVHECCPENHSEEIQFGLKIYFNNNNKDNENNRENCLSCIYKKIAFENSKINRAIAVKRISSLSLIQEYNLIDYVHIVNKPVFKYIRFSHYPSFYDPVLTVLRI